jgi:DNA modification methylase
LYGKDRNAAQAVTNNVTRNVMQQGIKSKDLIGIPWMLAFALRADGWYLRQDIIWAKPNPMPESVTDRCTKSHEYLFLLSKSPKYYFDSAGISELSINGGVTVSLGKKSFARSQADGAGVARSGNGLVDIYKVKDRRNKRSVWSVTTKPYKGAHFATFPPDLIKPCILAGCPEGGIVLDPFAGAFTTSMVSESLGRNSIGIELNPDYVAMGRRRIDGTKEQSLREFTKAIRRYTEELKNVREPD